MEHKINEWFDNNKDDTIIKTNILNNEITIGLKLNEIYEYIKVRYDDEIENKTKFLIIDYSNLNYLKKFNEQLIIKSLSVKGLLSSLLGVHKKYLIEHKLIDNKQIADSFYSYNEITDLYDYSKIKEIKIIKKLPNFKKDEHFIINKIFNDCELYISNYAKIIFINHDEEESFENDYDFLMPIDYIIIIDQIIELFCSENNFTYINFKKLLEKQKELNQYRIKYIDNIL